MFFCPQGEWNGAWSDSSGKWNAALRQELGVQKSDDGIFWMSLDDFTRYFHELNVNYYEPSWTTESVEIEIAGGQVGYFWLQLQNANGTSGPTAPDEKQQGQLFDVPFYVHVNHQRVTAHGTLEENNLGCRLAIYDSDGMAVGASPSVADQNFLPMSAISSSKIMGRAGAFFLVQVQLSRALDAGHKAMLSVYHPPSVHVAVSENPTQSTTLDVETVRV